MREVTAGNEHGTSLKIINRPLNDSAKGVMVDKGKTGEPKTDQLKIRIELSDEVQRNHGSVIQGLVPEEKPAQTQEKSPGKASGKTAAKGKKSSARGKKSSAEKEKASADGAEEK